MDFIFTKEFQRDFRNGLEIDYTRATLNGKNKNDFIIFWAFLFPRNDVSIAEVFESLNKLLLVIKSGPVYSWLCWLQRSLSWFCFEKFDYSIGELSELLDLDVERVAYALREEASQFFSDSEELIDNFFSVTTTKKSRYHLGYHNFLSHMKQSKLQVASTNLNASSFFKDLEVTVMDDWKRMIKYIEKNHQVEKPRYFQTILMRERFSRLMVSYLLMLIALVLIIFSVKKVTQYNEDSIFTKLNVPVPIFAWLKEGLFDKSGSEIQLTESLGGNLRLDEEYGQIEELESAENVERFDTESDVILTSIESLPRSFEGLDLTNTSYEEKKKGGFRDTRFGNRKVYRIMIKATDTILARTKIQDILETFGAQKSDRVEPGKFVPGGLYYNLFVPTKHLKQFLFNVNQVANSSIYLSKSRAFNPRGMSKVFLWVKKI